MSTAIAIRDLSKVFGSGHSAAVAVDHISLDIQPGELFFLLGPSGCGKTTLLRMIAGFIEPTTGHILFGKPEEGAGAGPPAGPKIEPAPPGDLIGAVALPRGWRNVTHTPPNKRNTGMVFQSYALWPHMTVAKNVAFGLSIRKVPTLERERMVADALAAVKMAEYAERKPNQLSGGQQQRVALARALVIRPDVLLLDEPLSNLDAKLRIELRSEIRRVCKESGITGVYVTHDQKEALSMADRIAVLDAGRIVQTGRPEELYRRPASRFVAEFLGETNFIEGQVVSSNGRARIRTAAGEVEAGAAAPGAPGDGVVLSIRPEAFRILRPGAGGTQSLPGHLLETTYLGELAQHTVELGGGIVVKVASLNPAVAHTRAREAVALAIEPADVVVLPREEEKTSHR
ncbi:MAG: ABC transporter ATP-binding protein [Phycisphaerales bacterium]